MASVSTNPWQQIAMQDMAKGVAKQVQQQQQNPWMNPNVIGQGIQSSAYLQGQQMNSAADVLSSMHNAGASMFNTQYGSDTDYNIAEGNARYNRQNLLDTLTNNRYLADTESNTQKYGYDRGYQSTLADALYSLLGVQHTADQNLAGRKYEADTGLTGLRYQTDAGLQGLGITGQTDRDVARINALKDMFPEKGKMDRFNRVLPMLSPLLSRLATMMGPMSAPAGGN